MNSIENSKTAFLANAVILKSMLQPESKWTEESSKFASQFFTNYAHVPEEDYLQDLKNDELLNIPVYCSGHGKLPMTLDNSIDMDEAVRRLD